MITFKNVGCEDFPCPDVNTNRYTLPDVDVDPEQVSMVMISECAPELEENYFYAGQDALFHKTTVQAFIDAGAKVSNIKDILKLGVYLTTAIKCRKNGYLIKANTIKTCSAILEKEISFFPNVKVFLLMGDAAIKSMNYFAKKVGEKRVIPAGSTYKLRANKYFFKGRRVFPSYLQAGPSFFIEKSKRRMIAEDIAEALRFLK